jgi:ATP-dependent helicase/nuclease subunit B
MSIVTVNTRLARRLRRELDVERGAAGDQFWETEEVMPWGAWLRRQWDEVVYAGRDERALLSPSQETALWERVIRESNDDLLNPEGTAGVAAQAWMLLHNWRIPKRAEAFAEVADTAAFFRWLQKFQAILKTRGFISEAELPEYLLSRRFEKPDRIAGFDEMTPVQSLLFDGCEETGLGLAVRGVQRQGSFSDSSEEIRAAARWARVQMEENPSTRVGVVFPDLSARRAAVSRIFTEVLGTRRAFHISVPFPLAEAPIVRAALLALRHCLGLSPAEAGQYLRSPYYPRSLQEGARRDLERRKYGITQYRESSGLDLREGPQRPGGWSRTFSRIVAESGWPGSRPLDSFEYQAAESWRTLLGEFAKLDAVWGELDFEQALSRLEKLAGDTGFGVEETDEPVQVMGIAEAAGARFDAMWLGGMHDGLWPPAARPHPFVPLELQRAAGVPNSTVEAQFAQAKRITGRLLRAADTVVCSYPLREAEAGLRPSPFLKDMPEWEGISVGTEEPKGVALEMLVADFAPQLGAERLVRGGMSVIADQSKCPFRAFATHRLGARGLDEIEPGLTDRERGTVTHVAMEKIWGVLRTQHTLRTTEDQQLTELVRRSVKAALAEKLGEGSKLLTRIRELEVYRLSGLVSRWLEIEKTRPPFELVRVEGAQRHNVGGVELEIRVDRVDRYEDGSLAILDYKTGISSSIAQWETERPEEPQLPMYSTAMTERVATISFVQLAAGKLELRGISDCGDGGLTPGAGYSLQEKIETWRGTLDRLGAQFVEGHAVVDPTRKACDFCKLMGFCRIAERGADIGDG